MSSDETRTAETNSVAIQSEEGAGASEAEQRQELIAELDDLVQRMKALTSGYEPPPFSSQRLTALVEESLQDSPEDVKAGVLKRLRTAINEEWFDPETFKGIWYMANYTLQYNADLVKRHLAGDYDTDEWGVDWEFLDVVRPFFTFLYRIYWRVETTGVEHIPIEGPALLVANHSGQLPWDGTMVATAVMTEHPAQRLVRTLHADWYPTLPFVSAWLVRMGQTVATVENGVRLLQQDEVVATYPEGYKGVSKSY
jgi:hypothetical protein